MKQIQIFLFVIFSALTIISCNNRNEGEKAEAGDALQTDTTATSGVQYQVDTEASVIDWKGKKPTGEHFGTLKVSQGTIAFDNSDITGGKFSLDMNSILVLDLKDTKMNEKLTGHLKSEDFFNTAKFPYAEFEITNVEPLTEAVTGDKNQEDVVPTHNITGNLKIKDIVKSISFKAWVNITESYIEAKSPLFYIDRAEWEIKYKSKKFFDQLKDDFIHDEIGLSISLKASKQ